MMLPGSIDRSDMARMQHSALRRRMLEGVWDDDLRQAMHQYASDAQLSAWGKPDVTKNLFRSVVSQLSILYDRKPIVDHPDPATLEAMTSALDAAGVWTQAPHLQRLVIGQRECLRRLSVGEDGALRVRLVPVDVVEARSTPETPMVPHTVIEYRLRSSPRDDSDIVTRDVLSVADPAAPVYRVESADGKTDLTSHYLGADYSGEAYPYRDASGAPMLPYVMTHALNTGRLLDPYEGRELVVGSLKVATLWTFWSHIVFDCSHPQRWSVNGIPAGLATNVDDGPGAAYIDTDPSSLLMMMAVNPDLPVTLGQFSPGGSPNDVGNAIRDYASDLAADLDLSPGDIQRSHGDARSGYAIHIVNEGKRNAQAKYEPQFRVGDLELLRVAAAMLGLDETGWSIQYQGLPLSTEERRTRIEEYRVRDELGVTSPVVLLAELEGITETQARARLDQIRQDRFTYRESSS